MSENLIVSENRQCGECALCCKILPIDGSVDLDKPAGPWCKHWSKAKGCGIYEEREEVCKIFFCFWRAEKTPQVLKPSKTKCVLAMYKEQVLIVYVDPATPGAWTEGEMGKYLSHWPERFVLQIGGSKCWVHPNSSLPIKNWRLSTMIQQPRVEP